ncbi:MAG: hypothetical protein IIV51_07110 [Lachnospiraceae bacterium]|nr:hypothetical protein [Lachnospiraceae bacterium]
MIKDIKTRYKILGGIGIAAIIALLIAIPAVGRSSKHNDVAVNDTEITSDALQKGSDIDSHQYPTSSADLESQSSEELTTANTIENSSEPAGETVDTTNVASNTVESEQGNQNVDTSNNTVVDNSNAPENVADNDTGVDNDNVADDGNSGDTVDVADNSDWNTKIETIDRNVEDHLHDEGSGYVVHEGDQARHDVGDSTSVRDYYNVLIEMGYTEEEALAQLREEGYNV